MNIINIGILAHVDAGKTTLTESLLYASGAISEPGSVEKGTTRTDTMLLERQRGITIQAAVTSFQWHRCKVNIVDTPGHMDFLAEVYRSCLLYTSWPVILRAVNTVDAMTATVEDVPFALLQKITQRITSEVKGVNRVLYDLTPKPSGTIEWE